MKKQLVTAGKIILFLLIAAGGGYAVWFLAAEPEKIPPPLTRTDLTLRMLESSVAGDYQAAFFQCRKLNEIGTSAAGFRNLELNVNYNAIIDQVRKKLDEGDIEGALTILREGRIRFGTDKVFNAYIAELELLSAVEKNLQILRTSEDPEARTAALDILNDAAAANPALHVLLEELAAAAEETTEEDMTEAEVAADNAEGSAGE